MLIFKDVMAFLRRRFEHRDGSYYIRASYGSHCQHPNFIKTTLHICWHISTKTLVSLPNLQIVTYVLEIKLLILSRVTAAAIGQPALIKNGTESKDPTYGLCDLTIVEVIIQCLSIVTACWGQLKPFLSWMRTNGLKIEGVDDPTSLNYKYSHRSHTNLKSSRGHDAFPLTLRDQILVTQDWEVDSQSSRAQIISEDQPWSGERGNRSPDRLS